MTINLEKGGRVDLTKGNPGLNKLMVGLGWDVNDSGEDFDLDALALLVDSADHCNSGDDFIFFNNKSHKSGSVIHQGDNLTGEGDGDDEQIEIILNKIPENISKIVVAVAIYQAEQRRQNFGQVNNSFIRIVDEDTNNEVVRYDLQEDFSAETAVIAGELYRHNGEWKFAAKGTGVNGGLNAVCAKYGL